MMMRLDIGDSVVVKSGVIDPDLDNDIGGWQGRVIEADDGDTVFIRWDSITLQEMGLDVAIQCENKNLDWEVMTLYMADVQRVWFPCWAFPPISDIRRCEDIT